MKRISFFAALVAVMFLTSMSQGQVTKLLTTSGSIHDPAGPDGNIVDGIQYYGSGNEDSLAEYGVATFNYTPADFGGSISDITQFDYVLTHNDQANSDGSQFALWLTTDDFDPNFTGLSYDPTLFAGLDFAQFTNISPLGNFPYAAPPISAGGDKEVLTLNLTAAQEADVVGQINASSDFSIIITATTSADDVTFTGFDDQFEPGGKPELTINSSSAVPEPTALGVLAIAGLAGLARRRRR